MNIPPWHRLMCNIVVARRHNVAGGCRRYNVPGSRPLACSDLVGNILHIVAVLSGRYLLIDRHNVPGRRHLAGGCRRYNVPFSRPSSGGCRR